MQILSLNEFIKFLHQSTGIQICLHDISGILADENLYAEHKYTIHSSEFCSAAKTTRRGLNLCMKCRKLANQKAVYGGEYFCGSCAYGLSELVYPVIIDFEIKYIIYVGNVIQDIEKTKRKIEGICKLTGVNSEKLKMLSENCKKVNNKDILLGVAYMVKSYIALIFKNCENDKRKGDMQGVVQDIKQYIDAEFSGNITLRDCAELYCVNEKYLGRIFKKNIGMSFHKYLNFVRCESAKKMMKCGLRKITEIAFACGYSDVTYFNRVFKQMYGLTPGEYRSNACPICD